MPRMPAPTPDFRWPPALFKGGWCLFRVGVTLAGYVASGQSQAKVPAINTQ